MQDKDEVRRASDRTTGEATDVTRTLREVHGQRHTLQKRQDKNEMTRASDKPQEKQQLQREASAMYTDRDTHLISK